MNPAVERITGYSQAEILALPDFCSTLIAPEYHDFWAANFQDALCGNQGNEVEIRHAQKNVAKIWLSASWQLIYGRNGDSMGIPVSLRDISKRKQAEEKLRASNLKLSDQVWINPFYVTD